MSDSHISEDLSIEGNVEAQDSNIIVAGHITGDISAGSLEVLESGSIQGAVSAEKVLVRGKHAGSINCAELALAEKADVRSDVVAKSMTSEKGARLRGKVEISGG